MKSEPVSAESKVLYLRRHFSNCDIYQYPSVYGLTDNYPQLNLPVLSRTNTFHKWAQIESTIQQTRSVNHIIQGRHCQINHQDNISLSSRNVIAQIYTFSPLYNFLFSS